MAMELYNTDKEVAQAVRNAFVKQVRRRIPVHPPRATLPQPPLAHFAHTIPPNCDRRSTMACGTAWWGPTLARTRPTRRNTSSIST